MSRPAEELLHELQVHQIELEKKIEELQNAQVVITDITEFKQAEALLVQREREFRTLAENMPDILIRYDRTGRRSYVNPVLKRSFAVSAEQMIGLTQQESNPTNMSETYRLALEHTLATGERSELELQIPALSGDMRTNQTIIVAEREANEQISGAIAIGRDITEHKKAEKKIQRLTQFYAALSQCNEAIVRCSGEEELLPEICRAVVQFGGMKMAWIGLIDEARQRVNPVASYGEGLAYLEGIEISLNDNAPAKRGPVDIAIREGQLFWVQDFMNDPITAPWHKRGESFGWNATASLPLYRNGVVIGAFSLYSSEVNAFDEDASKLLTEMASDISFALDNFAREAARKQAEIQLRESETRYKRIAEGLTDYHYTVRVENGHAVDTRQSWSCLTVTGYAPEDFAADSYLWIQMVTPEDRDSIREHVRQILEGKRVPPLEYRIIRKDGVVRWMSDTSILFKDASGNLQAYEGVIKDISERKAAEAQAQQYVAQLESALMRTVGVATTLIEMRDPYTAGHERRVAEIAAAIGGELGLDARRVEGLRVAGQLHDIGKISTPAEILAKPGKITAAEFTLIKEHAQAGYDALKDVEFPWPVAEVAWQHHERIEGSGYPRGLKGDEILLEARIMSVADVVEAMASHRPYRPGHGIDKALEEIERGSGSAYDTTVAEACLRLFREQGYTLPD
jgi:PAS domain S-box-containing protein/putative nucleotidyltransferase with HDIG domain